MLRWTQRHFATSFHTRKGLLSAAATTTSSVAAPSTLSGRRRRRGSASNTSSTSAPKEGAPQPFSEPASSAAVAAARGKKNAKRVSSARLSQQQPQQQPHSSGKRVKGEDGSNNNGGASSTSTRKRGSSSGRGGGLAAGSPTHNSKPLGAELRQKGRLAVTTTESVTLPWVARPWPVTYEVHADAWRYLDRVLAAIAEMSAEEVSHRSLRFIGRDLLKDVEEPSRVLVLRRRAADRRRRQQERQRQSLCPHEIDADARAALGVECGDGAGKGSSETSSHQVLVRARPMNAAHAVKRAATAAKAEGSPSQRRSELPVKGTPHSLSPESLPLTPLPTAAPSNSGGTGAYDAAGSDSRRAQRTKQKLPAKKVRPPPSPSTQETVHLV